MSVHLGQELRAARLAQGFTQVEVGERMGKAQPVVSRVERQADMMTSTVLAYLAAIEVDPWDWFSGLDLP